ncbi:hypothetical protein [Providencia stuartii]|uniref:Uncharacterized protein n=1 Tax=Providencia stuartii TaxID=588 RepID=A0A1S1HLC5_PROST|nr:hypothetical protein [Providencia stuartii]OHT22868.1 hypothetical protein A3Q29_21650 [Providencia stuartii]
MFDRHETHQSIVNIPAFSPDHLVKVTDREGKVTMIQTTMIRKVTTFHDGAFVDLTDNGFFELNLSVEDLFAQIQSGLGITSHNGEPIDA